MLGIISQSEYWSTARSSGQDGLGLIPYPAEINRTVNGTDLGVVPNDFALARMYGYQPVQHGWIVGRDRIYPDGNMAGALGQTDGPSLLQFIQAGAVVTIALVAVVSMLKGW